MGKYFGTDGFRGEANVELTVEHAFKVGRYLRTVFWSVIIRQDVVIGKDTRRSQAICLNMLLQQVLTASRRRRLSSACNDNT